MSRLSFLISLVILIPIVDSFVIVLGVFGPNTPTVNFKGRITEHATPVPAHVSLDVLYRIDDDLVPITLVQLNSVSNYEIHLSGLIFKNENITNEAILRFQSLSVQGGSAVVTIHLQDYKLMYENDVDLS